MAPVDLSLGSNNTKAAAVRLQLYNAGAGGISARYRLLSRLEDWAECREYDHHRWDWNGRPVESTGALAAQDGTPQGFVQISAGLSVKDKRPTAPLRLTPRVIERFTGLLLSEDRHPQITVEGDEDADDFLQAVVAESNFWEAAANVRKSGGALGSVLFSFRVTEGRFTFKSHSARTVHEVLWRDRDAGIPSGVLIQ